MDVDAAIVADGIMDDQRALRLTMNEDPDRAEGVEGVNGRITRGAFANPHMSAILAKFGKMAFARSSACMEFEQFLRRIDAGGRTCLEIGTYQGVSAIVLSQFFDKVVCVSIEEDQRRIIKHDIVSYLGIDNIEFYDVQTNDEKALVVKSLRFDFAYVDGDHAHDTATDFALVKHCGHVLFHEDWPLQAPVWNLVNSLPPKELAFAESDCFAYWKAQR